MTSARPAPDETAPLFRLSPLCLRLLLGVLAALVLLAALEIHDPTVLGKKFSLVDFHVFHLAGEFTLHGEVAQAYDFETFHAQQKTQTGADDFMPWTYPPYYNLVMAALATMPVGISYLIFIAVTLGLFLWVLRKLAGVHMTPVMIATLPAIAVTIRAGQNGFLIAVIMGGFCLLALRESAWRGVMLGLMAIKPHLGVGLALQTLLSLQIRALLVAAAVTGAAFGLATLIFGPGVWSAFLGSVRDSSAYLEAGAYPLYRMTSVYAGLRSMGLPANLAFTGQAISALAGLGLVVWVQLRGWELRRVLALTVFASTLVSPYNYDYDLCMLAVAFALAMPDLAREARGLAALPIYVAAWIASGSGLVASALRDAYSGAAGGTGNAEARVDPVSTGMFGTVLLVVLVTRILARAETRRRLDAFPAE